MSNVMTGASHAWNGSESAEPARAPHKIGFADTFELARVGHQVHHGAGRGCGQELRDRFSELQLATLYRPVRVPQ